MMYSFDIYIYIYIYIYISYIYIYIYILMNYAVYSLCRRAALRLLYGMVIWAHMLSRFDVM